MTIANDLYLPYGDGRYQWRSSTTALQTTYRYTGQRWDVGTGLYFYNARWYDPTIGRFLAADTIVPEPGNPQALNRYAYVLNNPLRYTDPTGHAECAAGDTACWQNEWQWKNRWYNAHGWFDSGNGWTMQGDAIFQDIGILFEMVGEAGISFASGWDWVAQQAEMTAIGQGIAKFGQALIGGLAQLQNLLGGGAALHSVANTPGYCFGAPACALPPGANNVYYSTDFLNNSTPAWIAMTTVHELAHVIDWHSRIQTGMGYVHGTTYPTFGHFSDAWHGAPLTDYAACGPFVSGNRCGSNRWERWAEALTVWVFGTAYKGQETARMVGPEALTAQMDRMRGLLNGWY